MRVRSGVHQHELARATGISVNTLKRVERREFDAPLWYYVQCALALGVELEELLDDDQKTWRSYREARQPPPPDWLEEYRERGERWGAELDEFRRRYARGEAEPPRAGGYRFVADDLRRGPSVSDGRPATGDKLSEAPDAGR